MKIKEVFIISSVLLMLFVIACAAPRPQEEKIIIKQVEPSQVILPEVGQTVGLIEVQGNSEGSFLAEIMNQMVAKLKGNVSSE